eukprot:TRINITY_DN2488_c0_g1_i1.p3 TRINITY_DN2488_c0_g1~~TRINITY_DN2488_c0_g1_i1.p3  ORF type:complete len:50 (-),score=8.49 TRINITY_DN2488_c0_g1_i1:400-549(-)
MQEQPHVTDEKVDRVQFDSELVKKKEIYAKTDLVGFIKQCACLCLYLCL